MPLCYLSSDLTGRCCVPLFSWLLAKGRPAMKKINETARSLDMILENDVLVVGSGPGGLAAALAAARAGARTALIDRNGCFGGNITQVGVEGFAWYRHEHTVDCEGIGIEFEERAKAMGAAMPEPQSLSHALDAEMFKWVADTLVQEAGVTPLLHRLCAAPILDNGVIRGVITESKAGREAILAKRVIDATGDADIATRAGAPVHKSPKQEMMAVSVMFSMSGVNKHRFIEAVKADPQTYADWSGNGEWDYETTGKEDKLFSPFLRKPFKQALAAGLIPASLHTIAGTWGSVTDQGDLTYLNLVHVPEIDGTDPNDLTVGEMRGRREAIYALEALRGYMPGCEDAKLRNFGMTLGIRDTRKIDALYNLTGTDVREQARFDDASLLTHIGASQVVQRVDFARVTNAEGHAEVAELRVLAAGHVATQGFHRVNRFPPAAHLARCQIIR